MKPGSAKGKGRLLENFVVHWLRDNGLSPSAIRVPGSGSGEFKGDIWAPELPVVIECKNQKRGDIWDWIRQAKGQAAGLEWVLIAHPPREPLESSVAVIPLSLLEKLFQKITNNPTP